MNLAKLLTSPTADALGWTLLHAVWQGFAIVLPTAITLHLLRDRSSALRYRIGILALGAQLLTSVITFSYYYSPTAPLLPNSSSPLMATAWYQGVAVVSWHQQVRQFLEGHLSQFVIAYLIGLVLFGLRLAGGWLYLQRLSRLATPPANALWHTIVDRLRTVMALQSVVQIRESASIAVPVVVGIIEPILLIPVGLAASLSVQEIEAVLAHELAHVKRQDYAVNLLQSLVDVLYFFHPALWWLSARVREERELCCDDLAVQACGGDGRRLAQALARIEELRLTRAVPTPTLAMAFAKKRLQLLYRVRRILGVPTRSIVSNRSLAGLTLVTILLVSVSVYAVQQQQPKPKAPKTKVNTQRAKLSSGSELHFDEKRNIQYVTWKGKKLSTSRVASLQRQWDQVMTGQLNLDDVNQPDRDILLSIIESDGALETQRLKKVTDDVQKTVSSSLADIPATNFEVYNSVFVDGKWTSPTRDTSATFKRQDTSRLATLFQESAVQNALQNLDATERRMADRPASLFFDDRKPTARKQIIDQKSQELNQGKIAILKAQAEQQRFAAEAVKRQMAIIDAQRFRLEQQRIVKAIEQQRIVMQTRVAKTDSAQAALSRQIDESERAIQKAEAEIERANQRLIEKQKAIVDAMKPVRETEAELRKLGYSSQQIHSDAFNVAAPSSPAPSTHSVVEGAGVRLLKPPVPKPPRALTIEPVAPAPQSKPAEKK